MATLLNYFKPKGGAKRAAAHITSKFQLKFCRPRGYTCTEASKTASSTPSTISPELRKRIEEKKQAALLKLKQKRNLSSGVSSVTQAQVNLSAPSFNLTLDGLEQSWYEASKQNKTKHTLKVLLLI